MPTRRTKRPDGRHIVNLTVEQTDGTERRVYFYGRADPRRHPYGRRLALRVEENVPSGQRPRSLDQAALRRPHAATRRTGDRAPTSSPFVTTYWPTSTPTRSPGSERGSRADDLAQQAARARVTLRQLDRKATLLWSAIPLDFTNKTSSPSSSASVRTCRHRRRLPCCGVSSRRLFSQPKRRWLH